MQVVCQHSPNKSTPTTAPPKRKLPPMSVANIPEHTASKSNDNRFNYVSDDKEDDQPQQTVRCSKCFIQQLRDKGIGVLITDHNVRETLDICDLAYIVSEGYILAHGTCDDILANQQVKEVYLGEDFTL